MADEIQYGTARAEVDVATNAEIRKDNNEGGELTLHSNCQDWTVARY